MPAEDSRAAPGPSAIEQVVERMEAIARGLPAQDGVACFNDLYLAVTRAVAVEAGADGFEDVAFLAALDVVFADVYFDAVDADERMERVAHAWKPLFQARARPKVAAIQFALAGLNAHINHDLSLALVETFLQRGLRPDRDSPQHRDYLRVNALLERVQEQVKARFAVGLVGVADAALGRLDDLVAAWSVAHARDAAWTNAEALWALRPLPELARDYREKLGRLVELAGWGLLTPTL